MPKARVQSGESRTSYLSRCMANEAKKFPNTSQRAAVCNSYYDRAKKKKK